MAKSTHPSFAHKLSLVALAVLGSSSALAEDPLGWYAGGNIGRTRGQFDNPTSITPFVGPGFVVNSTSGDDRDKGYKLYGGYGLSRNFALEAGYFDLGRYSYTFNTTPAGSFSGDMRVKGLNLDLVGILPVGDRFSVFGRVGAAFSRTNTTFTRTGLVPLNTSNPRERDTGLKLGVGMQYAVTDHWSVRAELERYGVKDPVRNRSHIDMASVGLVYYFGDKVRAAPPYVAPVVAAPAPPPPPVYVAPPPPAPVYVPPPPPPPAPYVPPQRPAKEGRN